MFTPQNFVDQVGPPIKAAWLNELDQTVINVLQAATTVAQVQSILGIPSGGLSSPITILQGGTGQITAGAALTALGGTTLAAVNQAYIGSQLYPQTPAEAAAGVIPVARQYVPYDVRRYGVVYDGVTDNTIALANAALVFAQSRYLLFDSGGSSLPCVYTTSPNWALAAGHIDNRGEVVLKCTGAGNIFTIDAGATANIFVYNMTIGDFTLDSNGSSTVGFYMRGIVDAHIGNIRVKNLIAGSPAFNLIACVSCDFLRPTCSQNAYTGGVPIVNLPTYGILFGGRSSTDYCSDIILVNPIFDHLTIGMSLPTGAAATCSGLIVLGGTCEAMSTGGVSEAAGNARNTFIGLDCESNTTYDWLSAGRDSKWINGTAATLIHFTGGAFQSIYGGQTGAITIDAACVGVNLMDLEYSFGGVFTITDNGSNTSYRNVKNATGGTWHNDVVPTIAQAANGLFTGATGAAGTNQLMLGASVSGTASAGGGAAIPATTSFFIVVNYGGTNYKIPVYAV
jgi:hypothetical protein